MALFIGSDIYRLPVFAPPHPLAIPRAALAEDLCRAMGWLPDVQYRTSPMADIGDLTAFHEPDYIAALIEAEATQTLPPDARALYRIGADSNPIHPAVFRRPATSAGGVMLAARLTAQGGIVHAPGGGNHHGQKARASGFCFVNDIALGISTWLAQGLTRIAYLDLDAHHGDGVETAFADDPRVLTISLHEAGRWPRTGTQHHPAQSIYNFPVPAAFNDSEFAYLFDRAILPLIIAHEPQAIMLLPGADALADDPMARLALSNNCLLDAAGALKKLAPRLVVLGGGGYNPYSLARAWACIWATLNDIPIPATLPQQAADTLAGVAYFRAAGRTPPAHWLTSLRDSPNPGPVRPEILSMEIF
ncbi:MAG: acetoin utilization protein AcuC [Rhodospirillales bacterium 20-60-12]|nr:MAG: acetoin utilization protein AcuC [Rhodospirillales bacterium 20-60-12]HQT67404.1 acetoin utilization protein AcuC [Acetobacteraceae bacterium]